MLYIFREGTSFTYLQGKLLFKMHILKSFTIFALSSRKIIDRDVFTYHSTATT